MKDTVQIFFGLLIGVFTSLFAGYYLNSNISFFQTIAIVIVILPAINDITGDLASVVSNRLTTMFHLFGFKREEIIKLVLEIMWSFVLVAIYYFIISLFFMNVNKTAINLFNYLLVLILSSIILSLSLSVIGIFLAFLSYKFNLDPDNFLPSVLSAVGDVSGTFVFLTLSLLFLK